MRLNTIALCAALAGCGTYPLGIVHSTSGQADSQRAVDILLCKDEARLGTNTDARVAGSFLAGLTIIGAPIAIAADRARERELFAQCLAAKGYTVEPPRS